MQRLRTVVPASWHVLFNQQPEMIGHVCDWHRSMAQSIECPDQRRDGDCSHVQHVRCRCSPPPPCPICEVDSL